MQVDTQLSARGDIPDADDEPATLLLVDEHEHRRPTPGDFEGKTVLRFSPDADNIWRIWFTDGTAFAIQCESMSDGLAYLEVCDACV